MPLNPDAVGTESAPVERSWTSKDALLYAVGVGAGTSELPFVTENSKGVQQQVLPTFAVIAGRGPPWPRPATSTSPSCSTASRPSCCTSASTTRGRAA